MEFSPSLLTEIIGELKSSLAASPIPEGKEEKKRVKAKEKQIRQLEGHRDKLAGYDSQLEMIGERNSCSKTDEDATFMRMKEDAMNNEQTKPGYNLQIGTENQYITDFGLFPNHRYTHPHPIPAVLPATLRKFPSKAVADAGYGSEENYRFMDENDIEAFVKYNRFHKEQRTRYTPDPFHVDSLYYNEEQDYYVCPMGQHMRRIGTSYGKTAGGYMTESPGIRRNAVRDARSEEAASRPRGTASSKSTID